MKRVFNKLVRDKIPAIIEANGEKARVRLLTRNADYDAGLSEKLREEVTEVNETPTPEEFADVLEVVYAKAALHGSTPQQLEEARQYKASSWGGFTKRILLIETE